MVESGRSAGGIARANKLSREERVVIARIGAEARWKGLPPLHSADIKKAIWGTPERMLKIGDVEVECYVLEDQTRVLSGRGMQQAIGLGGEASTHGGKLRAFLNLETIKPFVNKELAMAVKHPMRFIRPGRGGVPAIAFEATLLIDLCDAILKAKDAPGFRRQWIPLALQAQMITLSFAKAGIISAIDEITGFQEVREKDAIQKIVEKYLNDYARKWAKLFPDVFWAKLLKVKGYESYIGMQKPSFVGHWVNDIVYDRLAPGVRERLKELNPKNEKGYRRYKNHQFLNQEIGVPELRDHLSKVMVLMDAASSTDEFHNLLNKALPKFGNSLPLDY